jgi:hypothetical protein
LCDVSRRFEAIIEIALRQLLTKDLSGVGVAPLIDGVHFAQTYGATIIKRHGATWSARHGAC